MTPQDIMGIIVVGLLIVALLILIIPYIRYLIWAKNEKKKCRLAPHDYFVKNGGDGTPSHFHKYTCWNCGEEFYI